jgi:hypothetical protein
LRDRQLLAGLYAGPSKISKLPAIVAILFTILRSTEAPEYVV